jgi:hypothetical protein
MSIHKLQTNKQTNKQASKQKTRWPSKAAGFLQASRSD